MNEQSHPALDTNTRPHEPDKKKLNKKLVIVTGKKNLLKKSNSTKK